MATAKRRQENVEGEQDDLGMADEEDSDNEDDRDAHDLHEKRVKIEQEMMQAHPGMAHPAMM